MISKNIMSTLLVLVGSLIYLLLQFRLQLYLHFMATHFIAGTPLSNIIRCFRARLDLDLFLPMP